MDRIDQYAACHHSDDKKWAKILLKAYLDKVDLKRMREMAKKTLATSELEEIIKEVQD